MVLLSIRRTSAYKARLLCGAYVCLKGDIFSGRNPVITLLTVGTMGRLRTCVDWNRTLARLSEDKILRVL